MIFNFCFDSNKKVFEQMLDKVYTHCFAISLMFRTPIARYEMKHSNDQNIH